MTPDGERPRTSVRYIGPWLLWRGHVLTPRPWPRLKLRERIGWCLELGEDCYGIRWLGFTNDEPEARP